MTVRLTARPELHTRLADVRDTLVRGGVAAVVEASGDAVAAAPTARTAAPGDPEPPPRPETPQGAREGGSREPDGPSLTLELRPARSAGPPENWVAVLARSEPRDVWVAAAGELARPLGRVPRGGRVAAVGSYRRTLLLVHRPDLDVVELPEAPVDRDTLAALGVRGAVMGAAAARRAGLADAVGEVFEPGSWLTSPGQDGYVLIAHDPEAGSAGSAAPGLDRSEALRQVAAMIDDGDARAAVAAELAARDALSAGPDAPVGVLARPHGPLLRVRAMVADHVGRRLVRAELTARAEDPIGAGRRIADILSSRGAGALLR